MSDDDIDQPGVHEFNRRTTSASTNAIRETCHRPKFELYASSILREDAVRFILSELATRTARLITRIANRNAGVWEKRRSSTLISPLGYGFKRKRGMEETKFISWYGI